MIKTLIVILIISILLICPVFSTTNQCLDNVTLRRNFNYTFQTDTNAKNLTITRNVDCQFGCDNVTHSCRESPIMEYSTFFVIVVGLLIIFGVMIKLYKKF